MNNYKEIETLVKKIEIEKAIREKQANKELTEAYWNIGKLIVDAQDGKEKAKYGDELLKEDKAQVEFYMSLVDKYKKEKNVNNTIGLIITKQQNKLVANFVKSDNLIPSTYKFI